MRTRLVVWMMRMGVWAVAEEVAEVGGPFVVVMAWAATKEIIVITTSIAVTAIRGANGVLDSLRDANEVAGRDTQDARNVPYPAGAEDGQRRRRARAVRHMCVARGEEGDG